MLTFAGLYVHAGRMRGELGLSGTTGLLVAAVAWFGPTQYAFLAPSAFVLIGPGHRAGGRWAAKRRKLTEARSAAVEVAHELSAPMPTGLPVLSRSVTSALSV